MIEETLKKLIQIALADCGIEGGEILLEYPAQLQHGDFSTNVAMAHAKETKKNPRALAEEIVAAMQKKAHPSVEKIEVAGPGFINFFLSKKYLSETLSTILAEGDGYGKNKKLVGAKTIVEYTDPNPFKEFHIGHLMSNTIGESLARIEEFQGGEVKRACYQGDVGLHVAKTIWGIFQKKDEFEKIKDEVLPARVKFLGESYAQGSSRDDEPTKKEIVALNTKIFERSDGAVNEIYDAGKAWSLEYFEALYKRLGTKFDFNFFESETGGFGKKIVEENIGRNDFEKSEGAIVFRGDKNGLHTRVFINSQGLPTYEAKELGLAKIKYDAYPYDKSFIITANEVNDYFRVLLKALELVFPDLATKTTHLSHGLMKLPTGKMSSRTGTIVTAESLLDAIEAMVREKMKERELIDVERNKTAAAVAVGAIKFSILRQAIGGDIIYDFEKSISFEGDSGPYLQYTAVRAQSVLYKAATLGLAPNLEATPPNGGGEELLRTLTRFPALVRRACIEHAPHLIATYLTECASLFNSFYAAEQIIDESNKETTSYRLVLTESLKHVLTNGLYLLGIEVPRKM